MRNLFATITETSMRKLKENGDMTRPYRRYCKAIILSCVLNEDQALAKKIARQASKIAKASKGRITREEVRQAIDGWVKYREPKK